MIRLFNGPSVLRRQFTSSRALYLTKPLLKPIVYPKVWAKPTTHHNKPSMFQTIRFQSSIIDGKKTASPDSPTLKLSDADSKSSGFKDIKRLFVLSRPESGYIGLALLLILISSSVSMAVPSVIGKLLDLASDDDDEEDAKETKDNKLYGLSKRQFFTALGAVFLIGAIANASRIIILKVTGERLVARLRTRTMKAALDQDATFLDTNRVGDLNFKTIIRCFHSGKICHTERLRWNKSNHSRVCRFWYDEFSLLEINLCHDGSGSSIRGHGVDLW